MRNVCYDTRTERKMSQEEFAAAIGVSRRTVIRWEKDPESMPLKAMVTILAAETESAV